MPGVRIGDTGSLVKPGDPVPGRPGHYYEAGQYAPSPEHLTSIKLQEMAQAGLLPETGLDIYDKDGEISEKKIAELNIAKELKEYNINSFNPVMPPFVFIGLASVFHNIDKSIFDYLKIDYVNWISDISFDGTPSIEAQISKFSDVVNTTQNNIITGYSRSELSFTFITFQPFFVYLSVPIVPAIKNVSSGLNLSSVSTLKTLGYMLFDKVRLTDKEKYVEFLATTGWKQRISIPKMQAAKYKPAGSEIGLNRGDMWFRDTSVVAVSTSSTISPRENFSELFMNYYVHRMYLEAKRKQYVEFMDNFIEYIDQM